MLLMHAADAAQVRTAAFAALLVGLFLLALAESRIGLQHRERRNPWLGWMLIGVAASLAVVLGIPPVRALMGLAPPSLPTWEVIGVTVLASGAWLAALQLGAHGSWPRSAAPRAS